MINKKVQDIIRQFRITSKYKGYILIIDAIILYIDKDFVQITKDVYPVLSKKYHTNITNVERNLRTIVELCWKNNKTAVQEILGYNTERCPSNSVFIEAIAYYITNTKY